MRNRFLSPGKVFAGSLLMLMLGCDVFQKDVDIKPDNTQDFDMYVYQNKAVVLDVLGAFPDLATVSVPVSKSNVKFFNGRYLKYQSAGSNTDGFNFSVRTKNNQQINTKVNVVTGTGDNCGEAFTHATIKKNSRLVVNLFNNPEFCDYDIYDESGIGVADPRVDDGQINGNGIQLSLCACGNEGNTAILYYDPPKDFVGQVVSKYYLGVIKDGETISGEDFYKPDKFRFYSAHKFVIDVVDQ